MSPYVATGAEGHCSWEISDCVVGNEVEELTGKLIETFLSPELASKMGDGFPIEVRMKNICCLQNKKYFFS